MRQFLSVLLLAGSSLAAPSLSGPLDSLSLVPRGGALDLRSLDSSSLAPGLEIRGVVGGRKKRYIIARAETKKSCCGENKCDKAKNEYQKGEDCSCQKCPSGQKPNAAGTGCEKDSCTAKRAENGECCTAGNKKDATGKCVPDDGCPEGQKKNTATGKCEATDDCPTGQKKNAAGKCEATNDNDKKGKQGKCKAGEILDPAEGGQDEKTEKPVCVPDDSDKCKKGEVPATRGEGDKDPKSKVECGKEPEEKDKAKCRKGQYVQVQVQPTLDKGNKAVEFCERTRAYERGKKKKVNELKPKKQKKWDDEKPEREKKKKEEEEKKKKEEEEKKKKEEEMKKDEEKGRKKTRIGRCLPLGAFLDAGMAEIASNAKRDVDDDDSAFNDTLVERGETSPEKEKWEWTTQWFDEDYLQLDEVLDLWPSDLTDWNRDVDIDNDDFVKYYTDAYAKHLDDIQREELRNSPGNCPGSRKRCTAKRRAELEAENYMSEEDEKVYKRAMLTERDRIMSTVKRSALTERDTVEVTGRGEVLINEDGETVERFITKRGERVEYLLNARGERVEKRFWPIISLIASFLLRLAQFAMRFIPRIMNVSSRLKNILQGDKANLFKVAAPGRGAAQSAMRTASKAIKDSKYFKNCLKAGKPA